MSTDATSAGTPGTAMGAARDAIRGLEIATSALNRADPAGLLALRSQVEEQLRALDDHGADTRGERGRLVTVDSRLRAGSGVLVQRAGGGAGLARLRAGARPHETDWWWYLDEAVAASRRREARQLLRATLAVLVLVAAAYAVYRAVPKSPARIAAEHAATGDQLLARGDREGAAGAYERSLAANPGQAGVWATLSVLYALNGAEADADAALARARGLARRSGELPFLLSRTWEQVGEHGRALDEADAALAEDPRLAGAALVRASALEGLGRLDEALVAYTHAAQLALAEGDSTVYVSAQTRMGMLTQQGAAGLTPAPSD